MKCDKPRCSQSIRNDIYFKHIWGLVLCRNCFPGGKIRTTESIEDFLTLFDGWDIEYIGNEWDEMFVYYLELIETIALIANKLELVDKVTNDTEDTERSEYVKKLLE